VLYRGADILILDEPTAVLTPQETQKLFAILRRMRDDGKAIIIITHKLHEVLSLSDRVAVLRKGEYIGDMITAEADAQKLTDMMVGRATALNIERAEPKDTVERLRIRNLTVRDIDGITRLDNINLDVFGGEILGIAGISGCGQKELLEAIAGLQPTEPGSSVLYFPEGEEDGGGEELIGKNPRAIADMGVKLAFVPEDRLGMGLVGSMDLTDNMMLKRYREGRGIFADRKPPHKLAEDVVRSLEVVTPSLDTPVRRLSGGNVQKVLVGREIAATPAVLMSAYAVRGLDINTSYTIYNLLNEQKKNGVAVIYVGEDLDVLLELCDRIAVLCGGRLNDIVDGRTATKEQVGYLMTYLKSAEEKEGQA
jgi:simple sugar transport system ATP-binding protein